MSKTLSILIPTLVARRFMLSRLMNCLEPQITDEVEMLTEPTAEDLEHLLLVGEEDHRAIGTKRNLLVKRAHEAGSRYVCFIDDDDLVTSSHVPAILAAIHDEAPDVVAISGTMTLNGAPLTGKPFRHSPIYLKPIETPDHFEHPCNHLDAVRTDIAIMVPFPDISFGEDQAYARGLAKHLQKSVTLGVRTYLYDYYPAKGADRMPIMPPPPIQRRRIG